MPPCAHRVLPDCRLVFDTTVTRWPALARRNAQARPAAPLPMTRTSASFMERSGRAVGTMEDFARFDPAAAGTQVSRSEEHTSELQSLMRSSYAVFCLKQKKQTQL